MAVVGIMVGMAIMVTVVVMVTIAVTVLVAVGRVALGLVGIDMGLGEMVAEMVAFLLGAIEMRSY